MFWSLTVHDLSKNFVSKLQAMANTYLKKWAGLPRPANTAILFIGSSDRAGLRIKNLVTVWKQMQVVRMDILKLSRDDRCKLLYEAILERQTQWTRKYPPAVEHASASTVVDYRQPALDVQPALHETSSRSRSPPRRKQVTNIIQQIDTEATLQPQRQLSVQCRWLEWPEVMNLDLSWRRLIHGIDDGELHFTLRAITNTVPTPDNLRR